VTAPVRAANGRQVPTEIDRFNDGYRAAGGQFEIGLVDRAWADRLLVRATARYTHQRGARFYRAAYTAASGAYPAWRTADAELSTLWNLTAQAHVQASWRGWRWVLSGGRMWNRYPHFPSLTQRDAWIGGGGLDVTF